MGHKVVDSQKGDKEQKDSAKGVREDSDLPKSALGRTLRRVNSDHTLVLNVKRSQSSRRCTNSATFERFHGLESRVPKDMVSLDEKYLRHCLELIHNSASKVASFKVSVNLTSSILGVPTGGLNPANKFRVSESPDCSSQFIFDCSLATGTGKVSSSPAGQWIVGSIMGSNSMISIMKNPLFQRSGTLDGNFGMSNSHDLKDFPSEEIVSSPSQLSLCSSMELRKETPVLGPQNNYGIDTKHQRFVAVTSPNSTSTGTEKSSLSTSVRSAISQGMLHITWKGGIPHFVFSLDDQKEIYVTSLIDIKPTNSEAPQHLYLFYSRPHDQKGVVHDKEPCQLIGRMKVTTSLSLCSNNSKEVETEFVLFTSCETSEETQALANNPRRNKGLPKKMVGLFRNSYSTKQRSISRFDGATSPILENSFSATSRDFCSNLDALGSDKILRNHTPTNFELAAIIVRAHSRDNERQVDVGGWGLKFLRRVGVKRIPESPDETIPSDCCNGKAGDCSTSMDVIIPAGIHGGPRTRNGGPSTLTERWKSGGQCDCGGWDLGCPLTLLKKKSTEEEAPSHSDMQGNTKSFDLYLQGSKQSVPCLRMMNVREGLHLIHFQSTLSALQSFSIAVAQIHSQSPIFRPKLSELKQRD
ncbi:uncharacterized protein LOC116207979 [Punica granatum]|uniref:Uncharacterized protein LOC116207979 n=2 Tax=Punica granatum TaxID=22663 RepID=A0A6P8DUV0_PUNGR|nr:uncharacterized protein LOC116207979 [Punica granatum]XP_031396989.1 uncharacterized protein LOC116207979 [Punica granatum]XP_031396990.1 uncharacterized protein LOC116207979 [Punica granatum]XP_031396991.1 uncharacterized protein LOC116207979 [Punica granatum]PKI48790.1 hypothetical protein CRG98_030832 [Punica granatum]